MSKKKKRGMTRARRKRINRLKKIIVNTILLMIIIPTVGCIVLGIRMHSMKNTMSSQSDQILDLKRALQEKSDLADRAETLLKINDEIMLENRRSNLSEEADNPETAAGNDLEISLENVSEEAAPGDEEIRKVYLTFDDGPSIYTNEILDILAEYDVKATFFVTGKGKEDYADAYRRIVEEGHTLGMHSYSHVYGNIYSSLGNFRQDLEQIRDYLYDETGVISSFYRFPGGSSNLVSQMGNLEKMIDYLDAMGISYFDWNVSSGDADSGGLSKEQIINKVMAQLPSHRVAVVLLHDAGDKHSTVEALPVLIEKIQAMDDHTVILPITEETMLIQHIEHNRQ